MFGGRFSSSIGVVGVDFGSRSAKLLQLREAQHALHVVGAAHVPIPTIGSDAGAPIDEHALADHLRTAFGSGGFTGRRCVISLPRQDVRVQSIRLPVMSQSELQQAAVWEASQRFGFDRSAMECDYFQTGAILQGSEHHEEILLVAASHEALNPRVRAILAAGLRPIAVDVDLAALSRIYSRQARRETDRHLTRAVVEIGRSGSTVLVLNGDQIAFAKRLEISGQRFDQAVIDHLQLEPEAAIELRQARVAAFSRGGEQPATDPAADRAVFEAVRPLINDLVKEIILCLRYYGVTFRGRPPECVLLSGGDALEPQLGEMISSMTKIPVKYDCSGGSLETLTEQIRARLSRAAGPAPTWAVAGGLSIRELHNARRNRDDEAHHRTQRSAA